MAKPLRLIVGLGNPGPKYDQTRHNAGFWFVEALAAWCNGIFRPESKFHGEIARIALAGQDVWLLKPTTFMNRSGLSVNRCAGFYKVGAEEILVAHDEIDLAPGITKLKRGGGHGGHNGLRDIFSHAGKEFWRLRIGVGHPGHRDEVINYVLSRPGRNDEQLIHRNIEDALEVMPLAVAGEFERAMHQLHSG